MFGLVSLLRNDHSFISKRTDRTQAQTLLASSPALSLIMHHRWHRQSVRKGSGSVVSLPRVLDIAGRRGEGDPKRESRPASALQWPVGVRQCAFKWACRNPSPALRDVISSRAPYFGCPRERIFGCAGPGRDAERVPRASAAWLHPAARRLAFLAFNERCIIVGVTLYTIALSELTLFWK